MKRLFVFTQCLVLSILTFAQSSNLISNAGCEDALVSGEIPDWDEVTGTQWTQGSSQGAYAGSYYFYPGQSPSNAELKQDIDVSSLACTIDNNLQDFSFIGYVKSYNQSPPDLSQIKIEFRNATNSSVLYTYDSGSNSNTSSWKKISTTLTAPSGTRWIRIRLISTYQNGSGSNDGIYDSLYLGAIDATVPSPIELGNDTSLCSGNSLTLDASVSGATYVWSDNSTSATLNINTAGTYWVDVTSNNCVFSDTITLSYTNSPTLNLGNDTSLCQGETLSLNLSSTSGTSYLWSDNTTSSSFTISSSGKYWVDASNANCTASDTINVSYINLPTINLGSDTGLCDNETLTLNTTLSGASYIWQDNSTNATYNVTMAGSYWVDVTANGCTSSDTITISYSASPNVNLGNDTIICNTNTLTLDPSVSGASFVWSDNSTNSTLNVTISGDYWVIAKLNNCSDTDSITITYNSAPALDLGNDLSICENSTIILDATTANASTYEWSDNSSSSVLSVSDAGSYWVNVMVNSCIISDTIEVSVIPLPSVNLGNDTTICEDESLILDATTNGAIYQWSDNTTLSVVTAQLSGIYQVNVSTLCGTATDEISVEKINCECNVVVPNSFTPDNDNLNDIFIPVYECSFLEYELSIYNRFGEKIYTTNNAALGWDGKINGNLAEDGVYTWLLNYTGDSLTRKIMKSEFGKILLLK